MRTILDLAEKFQKVLEENKQHGSRISISDNISKLLEEANTKEPKNN